MNRFLRFSLGLSSALIIAACSEVYGPHGNPFDPDSSEYVGTVSVDIDGDGVGSRADIDDITLASPADGSSVSLLPVALQVSPFGPGVATAFWVQVSTDGEDFTTNAILNRAELTSNEVSISAPADTGFEAGQTYTWRARARDAAGNWSSSWSAVWSFTLQYEVSSVQTPSPADGDATEDAAPLLDWTDALDI